MNTIAYFEIQSSDPERDMIFYETVFGWKFYSDESVQVEYHRIETGSMHGGLMRRQHPSPPSQHGTNAFTCSVEVENFDQVSELIQEIGGQVALPKFAIAGKCWQGYFTDPDNNTFGIFEVDEQAK